MGLFGGDDDKKKVKVVRVPRGYVLISDDDQQQPSTAPWQQAMGQAQSARGKFWNNLSTHSWNVAKKRAREVRRRRPI